MNIYIPALGKDRLSMKGKIVTEMIYRAVTLKELPLHQKT